MSMLVAKSCTIATKTPFVATRTVRSFVNVPADLSIGRRTRFDLVAFVWHVNNFLLFFC